MRDFIACITNLVMMECAVLGVRISCYHFRKGQRGREWANPHTYKELKMVKNSPVRIGNFEKIITINNYNL